MRKCCEFIAHAPPAAEDQTGGKAHQAVTGTASSGDRIQGGPGHGDQTAHAGASHVIHGYVVFFKPEQHSDVSEAQRTAAF